VRFEIRYPTGATHEVELQGTIAILGRDPSCDLVINDVKCSRRHAVMEAGPDGLVVRDSGSANGVYVNGRKIDRVALQEGDEVKLGDVTLIVLPEEVAGTLVMAPDEYGSGPATTELPQDLDGTILPLPGAVPPPAPPLPHPPGASGTIPVMNVPTVPAPAAPLPPLRAPSMGAPPPPFPPAPPPPPSLGAPPPPAAPRPPSLGVPPPPGGPAASGTTAPQAVTAAPSLRGLTVTILAGLWGLNAPLSLLAGIGSIFAGEGVLRFVLAAFYLLLTGLSGVMGWGLWTVKPWARMAQIVLAGLGIIVTCPFAIACVSIIVYLLRPAVKARFAGEPQVEPKETLFAILVGVGVLLGGIGLIGMWVALYFGAAAQSIPVN
jgi:hypothetical protein